MTAPFAPEVAQVITTSHRQDLNATAVPATGDPFPLEVVDYTVSWDEDRSPRVIVQLDVIAVDEADVERFDPRTFSRVTLSPSYLLPDGTQDAHQVADLGLRERDTSRPENIMRLSCAGDEALYVDAAPTYGGQDDAEPNTYPTGPVEAIEDYLFGIALFGPLSGVPTVSPELRTRVTGEYQGTTTNDLWQAAMDAADALDADLYDNGDRVLRLAPRRYVDATPVLALTVGENGTLLESAATVTRENWFNEYNIRWKQEAPPPNPPKYRYGYARLNGPYAGETSGFRRRSEQLEGYPSQWAANAICRSRLARAQTRARSYRVSAVSAWWVRPGDTVSLQLPTGDVRHLLASSVTFTSGGRMTLVLRTPDTVSTIGE